jgi:hypothetical protein
MAAIMMTTTTGITTAIMTGITMGLTEITTARRMSS